MLNPVLGEHRGEGNPLIQRDEGADSIIQLQEKNGSTRQGKRCF